MNRENWETVYDAREVDDKVSAFTCTIVHMLDKSLPKGTVRAHPSDKPWMILRIKHEIKARQKAFTSGDIPSGVTRARFNWGGVYIHIFVFCPK